VKTPFLIGDTIYLRPLESEDAVAATRWFRASEVGGPLASVFPSGADGARQSIEAITKDDRQVALAIALRADDRLLGAVRLHRSTPHRRSGGYRLALAPPKELGTRVADTIAREATRLVLAYAFDTLNLNRVFLHDFASDRGARSRYASVGFREEGILRQEAWRDGGYEDVVVMAVLREEWNRPAPGAPRRVRSR
jgi:diamine N-acetyltransferase